MLRALLLDLGDTLVHADRVLPHVPAALEAFSLLRAGDGQPIRMALVSDDAHPPPRDPEQARQLFDEYVERLGRYGLRGFFEPVEEHLTLSSQAGVNKPDRRIFELALRRLSLPPD